ncbi:RNA-binding S4 domain-containing protein [Jongsikchunia kroppenstedtii]|uniref:RNA-binding S4 domain-containing protein n=1 Tax=Jongsikchunia kroppenstedtii TaxID=1121721 RepID=UPI00037A2DCF|nr:S4 domain-containing protein [Jongsikchunia kroppenstedtii]
MSVRVDSWLWSVRLTKTRSAAASACRAGHVRVNGVTAKPAQSLVEGDEVRVRMPVAPRSSAARGNVAVPNERIVEVVRLVSKRVGAPIAVGCYLDKTPKPPPKEFVPVVAVRDRGAGRPTKRDRRALDRLRGPEAPG